MQLAIYEDLLHLMRSGEGRDNPESVYQELLRHNWRTPGSVDGKAFVETVDTIMTLKSGAPKYNDRSVQNDGQITRLESKR